MAAAAGVATASAVDVAKLLIRAHGATQQRRRADTTENGFR